MKISGLLITLLIIISACTSEPPSSDNHMIFSTKTLTFASGDTVETISITHSCTCPFNWTAISVPDTGTTITKSGDTAWLIIPTGTIVGDHHDVVFQTRPHWYDSDTNRATIFINSNNYGTDSIQIVAIR